MPFQTTDPAQDNEPVMALRALKMRYEYMFARPHNGRDFYRGWLPDLIVACDAIDHLLGENKRGFHLGQVKEKFGSARYYWSTGQVKPLRLSLITNGGVLERAYGLESANSVEKQIGQFLMAAEQSSRYKCIVCSERAEIRSFGGWLLATCDRHGPDVMPKEVLFKAAHLREPPSEEES